jgi:hypothetical protein
LKRTWYLDTLIAKVKLLLGNKCVYKGCANGKSEGSSGVTY